METQTTAPGTTEHRSVCCHCSARCGVVLTLQSGRPVAIRGDADHPVSKGFICPRGRAAIEYHDHPRRLDHPLRRVGARGEGRWERASWDDALDDIAAQMQRAIAEIGPEAIGYLYGTFHGSDQGAAIRLLNLLGSPNSAGMGFICAGPKMEAEALTFGFGPATPDPVPGETRTVLVWSHRPSASNAPLWGKLLDAKRAGARLVVIDPYRTAEARLADQWLQIRPATDAALALGLIHVAIEHGWIDVDFVQRWTIGFDALRDRVQAFTPERVEEITGLGADEIIECARAYCTGGPALMSQGLPNGMGVNALNFERAKCCLMAVSGNLNRRGANRLLGPPEKALSKVDLEMYEALPVAQRHKRLGSQHFRLLSEGYERICAANARLWPNHANAMSATYCGLAHPPSLLRAITHEDPYPVRTLLVQHTNAVAVLADGGRTREALKSPNLHSLAVHEMFMTPTAMLADWVLPAAHWIEKPYMYVHGQNGLVLATRRAIDPLHERRDDHALVRGLAVRLGLADHFAADLEGVWDQMLAPAGLDFETLSGREKNWINDCLAADHLRLTADGDMLGFGTPSRKVELASSILEACGYDPLPDYRPSGAGVPTPGQPLRLTTGATTLQMTHSDHRQVQSLRKKHPDPLCKMHPDTGALLQLVDGQWVWLETTKGRIRQKLMLSPDVAIGTVDSERWWYPEADGAEPRLFDVLSSNVNALLADDASMCDPAYGTWPLREATCRVTPDTPSTPVETT
ncbi:molybdopterin-containing oxidoreductase family protein [Variovorax sp. VNK109]|uniref:molybdopterin-containing oxidoreductase family protein n=1 Tax=Variovorax sp. VNK109 TaxID=3400919 RepID=UPI003C10872D